MPKLSRRQKIAAEIEALDRDIGVVEEQEEEEPEDVWEATFPKCEYDEGKRLMKGLVYCFLFFIYVFYSLSFYFLFIYSLFLTFSVFNCYCFFFYCVFYY